MKYNTVIIGSGVAGMTAAIYLKRANISVCILEKDVPGGQITRTSDINNYPGFISIDGPDLAMNMYQQVIELGVSYLYTEAFEVVPKGNEFIVKTGEQDLIAKNVIIATGRSPRKLQVENEEILIGRGISYCAICDGSLYKGKKVAVIGGGRAALEESLYLSKICSNVTLIHRSDRFRADNSLLNTVKSNPKIIVLENKKVEKFVMKENKIDSIVFSDESQEMETLKIDGCFVYVGQIPNTSYFSNLNILDENGYINVDGNFETIIPNLYAIGDCIKKDLYQIITACSDGAVVANRITKQ